MNKMNIQFACKQWELNKWTCIITPGTRQFILLIVVFLVNGCSVSLSPKYEQAIIDNLSVAANQVFELTASVSQGSTKADFSKREESYHQVIGKLEALELQINARPLPRNKQIDKIIDKANEKLQERGIATLINVNDISPSATALKQVRTNISKMKEVDKLQGMTSEESKIFKGFITLYLDQALTYEKILNH